MAGLTLVPTPIGNLKDITFRAIDVLSTADLILAEDTRQTKKLLNHYNIETPLAAFHQHNEHKVASRFVADMKAGKILALVSDAGTPGISDPGFLLVREALAAGVEVEVLPGPVAFVPALVASGLPCEKFVFEGFLPHKKGRQKRLAMLENETRTMVFYESPHRIAKTLRQFAGHFGEDRPAVVARELTKLHEEFIRGTLGELAGRFEAGTPKGEMVIVVAGKDK